jgi:hypothetical protein
MSRSHRFEVRSCRTGHLEEVHASIDLACAAALILQREDGLLRCIVDAELPRFAADGTPDDRIVWRRGEPTDAARRWIVEQNRHALALEIARSWADKKSGPSRPGWSP